MKIADIKSKKNPLNVSRPELSIKSIASESQYFSSILFCNIDGFDNHRTHVSKT